MGSFPSHERTVEYPSTSTNGASVATSDLSLTRQSNIPPPLPTSARALYRIKKLTRGKLLFLGLDGAGKSTIVHELLRYVRINHENNVVNLEPLHPSLRLPFTKDEELEKLTAAASTVNIFVPDPTKTPQYCSYRLEVDHFVQIIDLPGKRNFRSKWFASAVGIHDLSSTVSSSSSSSIASLIPIHTLPLMGIVFVIDISDRVRFPIVAQELVRVQKWQNHSKFFQRARLFVVLNKTDVFLTHQQLHTAKKTAQRAALREIRRELQKCVYYELQKNIKRCPKDYPQSQIQGQQSTNSCVGSSSVGVRSLKSQRFMHGQSNDGNMSAGGATVVPSTLLTSIMECNALDPEQTTIKALHQWIRDEIKKDRTAAG